MAEPGTPRDDVERLRDENARLRAELERSQRELDRVTRERERLRRENERLKDELEAARRAAKRQAAPFSKGDPVARPKRPGRKPGRAYGARAMRPHPPRVDETIAVSLPTVCPHCAGPVRATRLAQQLQVDVPVIRPIVRRFEIAIGRCRRCGRRVQGRHARQTSDALGAAAHQLGPQALALTATLHTALGVPYAKIARLFTTAFGLTVHRSTLCRALTRVATRAAPTYTALADHVRRSPQVSMDETGWKVAAHLEWLWAAVTADTTVYRIQPGRGFPQAVTLLGADYDGILVRDGWAPYRRFVAADHQTCLAHVLRRCHGLIEVLGPTTARWPRAIAHLLQTALALRDRHAAGTISSHGLAVATGRVFAQLLRLLEGPRRQPALVRLAAHLHTELAALFTFLVIPGTDATTWRAEQALRPAVVLRKVCGGNRTPRGARTHEILASLLQTTHQRHLDPHPILTDLLQAATPHPAPALFTPRSSLQ